MFFYQKTAKYGGFDEFAHKCMFNAIQIEERGENVNGKEQDTSGYGWHEHENEFFSSEGSSGDA